MKGVNCVQQFSLVIALYYFCSLIMNKLRLFLFLIFLSFCISLHAQKLQFGIRGNVLCPVFLPIHTGFETSTFKLIPRPTGGVGVMGNFYFGKRFNLASGINVQLKSYSFKLYDFHISELKGSAAFRPIFVSPEVPLILNYEAKRKKDNCFTNYQLGAVFCYNIPIDVLGKQRGPTFSKGANDTLINSKFDVEKKLIMTFTYDIYMGVSWIKKTKKRRTSEWGISLQYPLKKSTPYDFVGFISTAKERENDYNAHFAPRLTCIAIHYIYYPKKWIIL